MTITGWNTAMEDGFRGFDR